MYIAHLTWGEPTNYVGSATKTRAISLVFTNHLWQTGDNSSENEMIEQ